MAKAEIDYKKAYEDLLYQVNHNISYLNEKSAEYDATPYDTDTQNQVFKAKAFAYKWSANKFTKSLEWLGIV